MIEHENRRHTEQGKNRYNFTSEIITLLQKMVFFSCTQPKDIRFVLLIDFLVVVFRLQKHYRNFFKKKKNVFCLEYKFERGNFLLPLVFLFSF